MRRWWKAVPASLALMLVVGACTVGGSTPAAIDHELSRSAAVSVSSSSSGQEPAGLVDAPGEVRGGREWRSRDQTVGAWAQLAWERAHVLRRVVIVQPSPDRATIRAGYLTFGDGSSEQVRLSDTNTATVVPLAPRSSDRVRFTVTEVREGARDITLAELAVGTQTADGDVEDGDARGNAGPEASVAPGLEGLVDGDGAQDLGDAARLPPAAGPTLDLVWSSPRELTRSDLVGATGTSRIASARVTFGDGAELRVGEVLADPTRPTRIAFMPRATTSLRLTIDRVEGVGDLMLTELGAYTRHAPPAGAAGAPAASGDADEQPCSGLGPPAPGLRVLCPAAGSSVGSSVDLLVQTPPGTSEVAAVPWSADGGRSGEGRSVGVDPDGAAVIRLDVGGLPEGPLTIAISARAQDRAAETVYFPVRRALGVAAAPRPSASPARGRTLVYAEEFDRPVSSSRDGRGADYAAAKPNLSGAEDFGAAVFADPASGASTLRVVDDSYLRIGVEPLPVGSTDPNNSGRQHLGGLLASARAGGSGFSAQYAYFEARIAAPAAPGTWPAFWMLPSDNLSVPEPKVPGREYHEIFGAEIDAVELYGHDPTMACHSTHDYEQGRRGGVAQCGTRFAEARDALAWHDYGVSVTPSENVFFVDGRVVASAPQVPGGGSPLFFLLDLALGGGWPVDLSGVGERTQLYVDHVRIFV